MRKKEVIIKGKKFNSIKDACKYYNLNYSTVYTRMVRKGYSIEDAIKDIINIEILPNNKPVILKNKNFDSITAACKYYNLNYSTITSRLDRGWSIEEAFNKVIDKRIHSNNKNFIPIIVDNLSGAVVNDTMPSIA